MYRSLRLHKYWCRYNLLYKFIGVYAITHLQLYLWFIIYALIMNWQNTKNIFCIFWNSYIVFVYRNWRIVKLNVLNFDFSFAHNLSFIELL